MEFHAEIGSTNDRARAALSEPGGEGLAVVADLQTAGRGRRGRTWISPAGANLLVSVAWRPRIEPRLAGLLGVAAALAVRDACASLVPDAELSIRWPNDLVDGRGRKVAGLLVETALEGGELTEVVVGIGINVNWMPAAMPAEIGGSATSLLELGGVAVDRVDLLGRVLAALDAEAAALGRGESPVARLRGVSWLDGRVVEVDTGAATIGGRAAGIADDGSLLLDAEVGRVALSVGEVARVQEALPAAVP
ncbi:MAG TPA: biotin--[acetyl-CoA-carboxylase] ligase, partial [Solirubrobacterales bacterium]|nr:biotin--[acetyl-CoA-carboxylase] ligase [Solirubrobacterales bacterium]